MTKRTVALPVEADETGESLFYNPALFGELGKLNQTNPHAVSVMLKLVADIDADGAVQFAVAVVGQQCEITSQEVVKAVAVLEEAGLIGSVQVSGGSGETLTCVVSPNYARAGKSDERCQPVVAEQ